MMKKLSDMRCAELLMPGITPHRTLTLYPGFRIQRLRNLRLIFLHLLFVLAMLSGNLIIAQTWTKAPNPIWTPWGESITDPNAVLREYPRPQMVRTDWQNLNGVWSVWQGQDINFT